MASAEEDSVGDHRPPSGEGSSAKPLGTSYRVVVIGLSGAGKSAISDVLRLSKKELEVLNTPTKTCRAERTPETTDEAPAPSAESDPENSGVDNAAAADCHSQPRPETPVAGAQEQQLVFDIIDTVGLNKRLDHPKCGNDLAMLKLYEDLEEASRMSRDPTVHLVLFVYSATVPFTHEERDAFLYLKKRLSENIPAISMLVVTKCDKVESETYLNEVVEELRRELVDGLKLVKKGIVTFGLRSSVDTPDGVLDSWQLQEEVRKTLCSLNAYPVHIPYIFGWTWRYFRRFYVAFRRYVDG